MPEGNFTFTLLQLLCDSNSMYKNSILLILGLQCWLAMEDCMCSNVKPCGLWKRIRFWLYMHPRVSIGLFELVVPQISMC